MNKLLIIVSLLVITFSVINCDNNGSTNGDIDSGNGEEPTVFSSISIEWPENFDYICDSNEPIAVTFIALDRNAEAMALDGTVSINTSNANVTVDPITAAITNGTAQLTLIFTNSTAVDQQTSLFLLCSDVMTNIEYFIIKP